MYRYTLEKYSTPSSRYTCPACGQRRKFTRYIDRETGQHLADHVGRCDRVDHCGYHFTPRQFYGDRNMAAPVVLPVYTQRRRDPVALPFLQRPQSQQSWQQILQQPVQQPASYLHPKLVIESTNYNSRNHFLQYLLTKFDRLAVSRMVTRYHVGTSGLWPGASIFWQIDAQERIRTGKIMLYDPATGHRIREPHARISWVHKAPGLEGFNLRQCLYGEHLLSQYVHRDKDVAIVESEKTAMIASIHYPEYVWLATGGKENLTAERMQAVRGRRVLLMPDVGACELWSQRAKELGPIADIRISRLLELRGRAGDDIADCLL